MPNDDPKIFSSRRQFIKTTTAGLIASHLLPWNTATADQPGQELQFGVCADIHKDIMFDAEDRLRTFIEDVSSHSLDFIIDMGDFCQPKKKNQQFRDLFHSFSGPTYHLLGNHEIDGGFTWRHAMDFLQMPEPFYSFDKGGYHFVGLDGNNKSATYTSGYPKYVSRAQIAWLNEDLTKTQLPTIIFSHQSLDGADGGSVDNHAEVRAVLDSSQANVIACFTTSMSTSPKTVFITSA